MKPVRHTCGSSVIAQRRTRKGDDSPSLELYCPACNRFVSLDETSATGAVCIADPYVVENDVA
jgi:hypothetical protein